MSARGYTRESEKTCWLFAWATNSAQSFQLDLKSSFNGNNYGSHWNIWQPTCNRISDARRVGATRVHLAGLAAARVRLARETPTNPLGLRRNYPHNHPTRGGEPDCD